MYQILIIVTMIFLHIIDDFNHQGIMAEMKQKKWWVNNPEYKPLYKYDYYVVLILHGFKWSFIIHLPLLVFYILTDNHDLAVGILYLVTLIGNGLIHSYIDDIKANKLKINLVVDQIFHIIQIILLYGINRLLIMG